MWLSRFLRGAWRTLPVETLVVALAAVGAIGMVHSDAALVWVRLVLAAIVLTPLAFTAHRLGVRRQLIGTGAASAVVIAALVIGAPDQHHFDSAGFVWPFMLSLLAAMLVPFIAAGRRFPHFVRRFFEETTTWGLLWLGALGALLVVFQALRALFDLRLDRMRVDVVVIATAAFVLVYLHRLLAEDRARPGRMPELWRRLATTVGAPFVCVMLVILVVYEAAVVVRHELPRNMLSPLILGAGFVGFMSTLIVSSVLGEDSAGAAAAAGLEPADRHRWARSTTIRVMRAFPVILLMLLPMAGWALWERVDEYGFTPFRVARAMGLVCLAVLSIASAIRWLRGHAPLTWQVAVAIAGFALLAAFGPASTIQLTIWSQSARLAHELDARGAGRVVASAEHPAPDRPARPDRPDRPARIEVDYAALQTLSYEIQTLNELGGEPALRRVLTGAVEQCTPRWAQSDCLKRLGIFESHDHAPPADARVRFSSLAPFDEIAIDRGRIKFVHARREIGSPPPAHNESVSADRAIGYALTADSLVMLRDDSEIARASLAEVMAAAAPDPNDRRLLETSVPVRLTDGTPAGELAISVLDLRTDGAGVHEALRLDGVMIWRAR
ncbi:MAG TPA: hypothetical protein VH165_05960 [Kofleriaceae bacterium]|jgi:hypothetical protein|nr:hypothetical protein [Kofleriaceae bacterium]